MESSNTETLKYLDLSGYAFTGKTAVIELLREFEGLSVAHFQFEFELIRIQGGIRDLETALVDDWSPVRSDAAIRRFRRLARRLATRNSWMRPASWFTALGWNYDVRFNGKFTPATERYLERLVQARWRTSWPYPAGEIGALELFGRKLLQLAKVPSAFDFDYCLAAPSDFLPATREYLQALLEAVAAPGAHTVALHNSFEPFNPMRALRYFHDARSIIVDRDPRDVYASQHTYVRPGSRAKPGPYRPLAVTPEIFCQRFRLQRQVAAGARDDATRILRLRFEDVVSRYDDTVAQILSFLGLTRAAHAMPRHYFQPEVSARNVGLWRSFPDQEAVSYIARELPEFCLRG